MSQAWPFVILAVSVTSACFSAVTLVVLLTGRSRRK